MSEATADGRYQAVRIGGTKTHGKYAVRDARTGEEVPASTSKVARFYADKWNREGRAHDIAREAQAGNGEPRGN